jgi:hypothetical protein
MNRCILAVLGLLAVVYADRTEQGNLLAKNTVNINGHADGIVTLNMGPFGTPPTLKMQSDKPTVVGVHAKPANQFPNPLPSNQGLLSLALAGYAGLEITSSNPDAKCEYELITIDLTAFLTGGTQTTGIMCDNGPPTGGPGPVEISSSGSIVFSSSAAPVIPSSSAQAYSSSAPAVSSSAQAYSSSAPAVSSSAQAYSSSAPIAPSSSAMQVVASSSGVHVGGGGNWECVPCENQSGKLVAKLVKTGVYVFVSIEKILKAVFANPCEILAGLNRTIEWATEFAMDCKMQAGNMLNVTAKQATDKGDAQQRHRDCGEDMDHFYDVDLARLDVDFETVLQFKYTEQMLTQKGFCNTCGKNLRWVFFDELTSKWKFPESNSEVDVNKKECNQKTKNTKDQHMPKSWAVVYASELVNGTMSSSGGGGGVPSGGFSGDRSAAEARVTPLMAIVGLLALAWASA